MGKHQNRGLVASGLVPGSPIRLEAGFLIIHDFDSDFCYLVFTSRSGLVPFGGVWCSSVFIKVVNKLAVEVFILHLKYKPNLPRH